MATRKKYWERCPRCRMRRELCLCALMPQLSLATRVVILMHKREAFTPTNTGHLAALLLTNSVIHMQGVQGAAWDLHELSQPDCHPLLLYPAEDAAILTPEYIRQCPRPITLVVPDGNWRQTSKMRRRSPFLATIPTVILPPGPPSAYHVRKDTKDGGLATMEAIARALGVLEGDAVQNAMEEVFHAMVTRTLASRGQKPPSHALAEKEGQAFKELPQEGISMRKPSKPVP